MNKNSAMKFRRHFLSALFLILVQLSIAQTRDVDTEVLRQLNSTTTPTPNITDVEVCEDETIPELYVSGAKVKWYSSQETATLLDTRNNQTYQVVRIGDQTWMAENLNVGNMIYGGSNPSSNGGKEDDELLNSDIQKYCIDNVLANCGTYGGLYQWEELMNYGEIPEIQGICPSGWHVPSHEEWMQLEIELGMDPTVADDLEARGTQGADLKVNGGSGFEALMAGKRTTNGTFGSDGEYTTFWTSTDLYDRTLSATSSSIYASIWDDKKNGFSVRCVQDSELLHTGNYFDTGETEPGIHTFYVSNTEGGVESSRVPITLTIHPAASLVEIVGDKEGCEGDVLTLSATGGNYKSYLWNPYSSNSNINVTESGNYSVEVTDYNGCVSSDVVYVLIHESPDVDISGDSEGCNGYPIELDAGVFEDYDWSTGEDDRKIMVSQSGSYSVTVTDINGCQDSDSKYVSFSDCVENYKPEIRDLEFTIEENRVPGTSVCRMDAHDNDEDQELSFSIISGNEGAPFVLEGTSDQLKVNASQLLNHEINPQFVLEVRVQDNGVGALSDTAKITINISDINEAPVVENQSFEIDENIPQGAWVGYVQASDEDFGQSLMFDITFGNEFNAFKLDPVSGGLTVNNPEAMDFEENPHFTLDVSVSDNAPVSLETTAKVDITLIDLLETGVEETIPSNFRIFPNPSAGNVSIAKVKGPGERITIEVYDSRGSLCRKINDHYVETGDSNIEIPLDEKGIYFIKVNSNEAIGVQKVIRY